MWGPRWLQGLISIKLALMVGQVWSVWGMQQGKELWTGFWERWGEGQLPIALLPEAMRPGFRSPFPAWRGAPEAVSIVQHRNWPRAHSSIRPRPVGVLSVFGRERCLCLCLVEEGSWTSCYLWLFPRLGSLLGSHCTQRVSLKVAKGLVTGYKIGR